MKDKIRKMILEAGACKVGFAKAEEVSEEFDASFDRWLSLGMNGCLEYMSGNRELRRNPSNLLSGVKTVISAAFSYNPSRRRDECKPMVSFYAYGRDYHKAIRSRLKPLLKELNELYGAKNRLCVDSAPIPERYWALKSGLGVKGLNGSVIVEGAGGLIFLAEILTTLELEPDEPSIGQCMGCGKCIDACPTGAITPDGVDASRCLSALTIERKGEWSAEEREIIRRAPATLFGCDRCQTCCPYNLDITADVLSDFRLTEQVSIIDGEMLLGMSEEDFDRVFAGSPLRRAGLASLLRNIRGV
ncbi:MAG: tRNA epoxyqueuosine(34) reductase QueG [Prevotella sp.]|nr:tRNA epoxyqueuosine(34) reductase QueG [Bacteroides sp.]MCM1366236.1 tRNA epoxyqueuosine(34) reductase QueG [Prevotella sp.]MCM1436359.1 tRNA epoxyqueuosine(34) reductase QueG [Prevotella sp.]